jgi:hypothetical protein
MVEIDLVGDGLGWIKLHRKLIDSELWQDSGLLHVFLYCVLKANHKQKYVKLKKGKGYSRSVIVQRGQFIFGRLQAGKDMDMAPSTVWRRLQYLQKIGVVDIKSDSNKSIITVLNYNLYQGGEQEVGQVIGQVTDSKRTGNGQVTDTTNKDKNEKNDNIPYQAVADIYNELNPKLPKASYRSPQRDKLLRGRWNQHKDFQSLDWWRAYFQLVADSTFLQGQTEHKFKCDLGWLLNPSNFIKVLEGRYTNQSKPSRGDSPHGESKERLIYLNTKLKREGLTQEERYERQQLEIENRRKT